MTDKQILTTIIESAKIYKKDLAENVIMFIYEDREEKKKNKFMETLYFPRNFKHLTGIKANITARDFYLKSISQTLTIEDLDMSDKYKIEKKLKVLRMLMKIENSARMVGAYNTFSGNKLYTENLVGNIRYCLGYILYKDTGYYIPNTALDEDIRNITHTNNRILAIMKKPRKEKQYSKITYIAKDTKIKEIFNNKKLSSLVDFKNIYFYNKANLVNTKLVDNLKKSMKKETKTKPHD